MPYSPPYAVACLAHAAPSLEGVVAHEWGVNAGIASGSWMDAREGEAERACGALIAPPRAPPASILQASHGGASADMASDLHIEELCDC